MAVGASPITDTGERDLVCSRRAWQRAGAAITTDSVHNRFRSVFAGLWIVDCIQAGTIECIEESRMEVAFQTTLDMSHVCPATMDARIAQEVVGQAGVNRAHLIANRGANLAT